MRAENYTFDHQDKHVCENRTRKGSLYQQTDRRAIQQAVANAPNNNGYAHAEVAVPRATNKTIYVLADSWRSLSANSCQACLPNASASMMGCLPWSKGRALYTRCFLRYSDVNFLNAIANSGDSSSNGNVMVIVIAVVSAVVVFVLGAVIAFYMWKNKQIQKKRKGSNDVEKLVKTLNDSSLNFK